MVLHRLAYELANQDYPVYIFTEPHYPHPNISRWPSVPYKPGIVTNNAQYYHYTLPLIDPEKTVVIYPEIQDGNPYNFPHVTRWILYHTHKRGRIEDTWSPEDVLFNFGSFDSIKKCEGILRVVDYKFDQLYDEGCDRSGYCHIIHKETPDNYENLLEPFQSKDLTKWENKGYEYFREELNKFEYLLLFDSKTFNALASLLCGCKVILLNPDPNKTPEQYRSENPHKKYGLAYGMDDLNHADQTLPLARGHIKQLAQEEHKTVLDFIKFWETKLQVNLN